MWLCHVEGPGAHVEGPGAHVTGFVQGVSQINTHQIYSCVGLLAHGRPLSVGKKCHLSMSLA